MPSDISDWTPVVDSQTYARIGTSTSKEVPNPTHIRLAPDLNKKEKLGFNYIKYTKDYVFYTIDEHDNNKFLLYFRNLKDLAWEGVNYELIIGNYEESLIEKLAAAGRCGERNLVKSSSVNILKRMVQLSVKFTFFNLTFDEHFRSLVEHFSRKLSNIQEIEFAGETSITPEFAKLFSARLIQRLRFSSTQVLNDEIIALFEARMIIIKSENVERHHLTIATLVRWSKITPVEIEVLNTTDFSPKGISNLVNLVLMDSLHIYQRFTWTFLLSDNDANTLINLLIDKNTVEFLGKQIMVTNKNSLSCVYLTIERGNVSKNVGEKPATKVSLERIDSNKSEHNLDNLEEMRLPANRVPHTVVKQHDKMQVLVSERQIEGYGQISETAESNIETADASKNNQKHTREAINVEHNSEPIYETIADLNIETVAEEKADTSYWRKMMSFFCGKTS